MNHTQKLIDIQIDAETSVLETIHYMDKLNRKLLIVNSNKLFLGIISIGDIQRAILGNKSLNSPISEILRKNIHLGSINDKMDTLTKVMIENRTEFMPIIDGNGNLHEVIFWEDIIEHEKIKGKIDCNIPIVIMAGGEGSRLKPITNIIPKPLVPIGERAFIEIIMDTFNDHGLNSFLLSVNYKADLIKYSFDHLNKPFSITSFDENKPLGTAGSIQLMKEHINTTFFVSNCDILIDQDYAEILKYHRENNNELTAVAAIKTYSIPYGTMEMGKDGLLQSLKEKPENTYYVNAGLYILEPHLLKEIPENEFYHITHLMEKIIQRNGKVGVFPVSEGAWMDIGEWNEYRETQQKFNNRFNNKR
jgi:dTDP-glucose pyrophosphorylase